MDWQPSSSEKAVQRQHQAIGARAMGDPAGSSDVSHLTRAWLVLPRGGIYRNLETGLVRAFRHHGPQRGKWERVGPITRRIPHAGNAIYFDWSESNG